MEKPRLLLTNKTIELTDLDIIFTINGYIGGGLLSLCLIPQLIKTIKTKSTKDISYIWQGLSMLGLSMIEAYGIYFLLYPVFIPILLEFILMLSLTVLKYVYDKKEIRINIIKKKIKLNKLNELNELNEIDEIEL